MASKFFYDQASNTYETLKVYLPESCSRPVPLSLTVTAGSLGIWLLWKSWRNRNKKLPPSPPGWPLLGNMMDMSEDFHLDMIRLQKKHNLPDVFMIRLGPCFKFVVLNSYDAIRDAFVTQGDLFANRPFSATLEMMEMKSEITMDYTESGFRENKAFIMSCMRNMGFGIRSEDTILDQVERLMNVIDKSSLETKPIETSLPFSKTAANVIFKILFNKTYEFDDQELLERISLVKAWYNTVAKVYYVNMLPYWLGKMLHGKEALKVTENFRTVIRDEIKQHLQTIDNNDPRDFLDLYLTKKKSSLDETLLTNTVLFFLPDSIDTVGCFVDWIILHVVHHKSIMTRMQEEIDKVTGGNRLVKWSDRPNLPYVEAVILEITRLRSPVSTTGEHTPIRDCYFRGHFIPKGITVLGNLYAARMDPQIFTNPEEFRPERWLTDDGNLGKTDTWIPFGMGHRMCVGDQVTKMQMFLIVANLVQRYNMSFPEGEPAPSLEPRSGLIIQAPRPFKILFEIRK